MKIETQKSNIDVYQIDPHRKYIISFNEEMPMRDFEEIARGIKEFLGSQQSGVFIIAGYKFEKITND